MIIKNRKNKTFTPNNLSINLPINLPINIQDIDKFNEYNYINFINNKKTINTGCLLITNNINTYDIFVWCYYHLNIINFNKIILVDNTELGIHKTLVSIFKEKIEYHHNPGILYQNEIYNKFVNDTNIQWILPIDDDEYLYISDKYDNDINKYLEYQLNNNYCEKYAFKWHIAFSKELIYKRAVNDSVLELFNYVFLNNTEKRYDDKHIRYAFPFIKTIVNTDLPHLYLDDNGNKKRFEIADFMNNDYPSNKLSFSKNVFFDILGSVHNPITYKDNKFIFAYNEETDQYYNGMYSLFSFNQEADAFLYHFKYRTELEYLYKCNNFKFPNILTKHVEEKYNNEHFNAVVSLVKDDIYYDNKISNLYSKHKDKIYELYNANYKNVYYQTVFYTDDNNSSMYDAVIALTSWKNRINSVYDTINSIKQHNKHKYLFVLTLSSDEFLNKEEDLPKELLECADLKILWVKYNYKSFKKYLFTMQMYKDLPIITADDGDIYISNSFDVLFDNWQNNKNNIYCYIYWPSYFTHKRILMYSINSGTSVIFPPHCFNENAIEILNNNRDFLISTNEDDFYTSCLIKMFNKNIIKLNDFNNVSEIYYEIDEPISNKLSNLESFKDLKILRQIKLNIITKCFKDIFF